MIRRLAVPLAGSSLVMAVLLGCSVSGVKGPQLRHVPEGFGFRARSSSTQVLLSERPLLSQRGYNHWEGKRRSSILINEYAGAAGRAEVEAAVAGLAETWANARYTYDPIETVEVDGQQGWAWMERQPRALKYVAVVPYQDVTFSVEFFTTESELLNDEVLRKHVLSFSVDPDAAHRGLVRFVLFGGIAGFAWFAWRLSKRRHRRR